MRPKIALVVDIYNWAFYNRAKFISRELSKYYDFKIIPVTSALKDNVLQLILLVQGYDLVHFFWRGLLFSLSDDNVAFARNNINVKEFIEEKFSNIIKTTCVPDHSLLDEEYLEKTKEVLNFVDNYYVLSERLLKIYKKLDCKKPYGVIYGGVDGELFEPGNLERFEIARIHDKKIIIGWSGNSKWGNWEGNEDVKGVETILKPAINELIKEGYDIELKLADSSIKFIPINEMKEFYNSIDILICISKHEGGPNPILEAMACGVPVVSTDVGFVREVLGEKQQEYILTQRNVESLKSMIKIILENRETFKKLSEENLYEIKKYTNNEIAKKFKEFFDDCLEIKSGTHSIKGEGENASGNEFRDGKSD
jgi:glycosyltransferase involved in cell wall biosynthesis